MLRAGAASTARELAQQLGVSERTVLRDLATLREQGVPLETQSGPGGGIKLERDRGVVAVHFALDEVIALWLAATLAATTTTNLPWSDAARRGLNKILANLPRDRARALRAVVTRVIVGRPASPTIYAQLAKPQPELLSVAERCFTEGLCMAFQYLDRHGNVTQRTVEPHGLLIEHPAWYLLCRDVEKSVVRSFRLDRMRRARALTDRTFRPDLEALHREYRLQQGEL